MGLPKSEKVRVASTFLEEVMPDIEIQLERAALDRLRVGESDAATSILQASDVVKTAIRKFTTPEDLSRGK